MGVEYIHSQQLGVFLMTFSCPDPVVVVHHPKPEELEIASLRGFHERFWVVTHFQAVFILSSSIRGWRWGMWLAWLPVPFHQTVKSKHIEICMLKDGRVFEF